MTFYAIAVTSDATITEHQWTLSDEVRTLEHLQSACGGLVDVVALGQGVDMWIPDEGLYDGSEPNAVATAIAVTYGFTHQGYYGTAVFTGGPDLTGATLPLSPERGTHLLALAQRLATGLDHHSGASSASTTEGGR